MTHSDIILKLINDNPEGLDDDEISEATGISPRQQVYQICTRLRAEGLIRRLAVRKPGKRNKTHNYPLSAEIDTLDQSVSRTSAYETHAPTKSSRWRRQLGLLSVATDRDEGDLLEEALKDLARKLLKAEESE